MVVVRTVCCYKKYPEPYLHSGPIYICISCSSVISVDYFPEQHKLGGICSAGKACPLRGWSSVFVHNAAKFHSSTV